MNKLNEYVTVGGAASYLGVSKDTLRRWDAAGKLKARRHPVTGFRLYLVEELAPILAGASRPEARRAGRRRERIGQ
jgi:excisionase family DNA binding protein